MPTNRTSRFAAAAAIVLALFAYRAPSARAQTEVWPDPLVATDVFTVPLWLSPYEAESGDLAALTRDIEEVVFNDLRFTGLFEIHRNKPVAVGMQGADFSVEVQGKVFRDPNSEEIHFEGWVTELGSGKFMGGKKYRVSVKTARSVAHHFSDEVVRLVTGENGVATTRIVFTRRKGDQWELVFSDYDGYNPKVIVRQSVPLLNPRWADNDNAIIYTSYRAGKPDLYIRYLSESKSRSLAAYAGQNNAADWSQRRRHILASLSKDGNSELYILEKSGNIRNRLTHNRAIDTSPCWSPNGREIVFTSDRGGSPQLYVMERDGTNVRRLTYLGGYNATPAWSPKGDLIAFVSRVGNEFQIATITPDGRDGRLATKDANSHEDPRWAPNGRHIVFTETSRRTGSDTISVVDIVTGGKTILAQGANPDWSRR